ncbi:MAG: LysR family transcriptional regulator [Oscillospiraceae bacterium]|nr:LysR family transcriptional regulator [Lachnospiraceae bacterium]MBR0391998.1 LysR family transcriptional regulator [Oscillospiraceae bacterium]
MQNRFMRVEEVAAELGVSVSYAYKVIRRLNDELKEKGFVTIAGRINRQYFNERVFGTGKEEFKNAGF